MPKLDKSGLTYPGVFRGNSGDTTEIGTYHMADNPDMYEPQRTNNFEFVVTGLDNLPRVGSIGDESNAVIKNAAKLIRVSVSQASIPHFTQGVLTVKRGNGTLKYAGVPTFEGGQIVLNDYIGVETKDVLMSWQNLSYNVMTEKVGLASDYKKDCVLIEYSPEYQIVRKWNMHGCWISGLSEDPYNHEQNDIHKITATIQYDRAEIDTSEDI